MRKSSEWWRGERAGFAAANEMKAFGRAEVERAGRTLLSGRGSESDYLQGYRAGYDRGALGDSVQGQIERDVAAIVGRR